MTDLITWLRAQLDEDEELAHRFEAEICTGHHCRVAGEAFGARFDPARVLAEVAAKRRLIDTILKYEATIDGEWGCCHSAEEIAAGECSDINPNSIPALLSLAVPFEGLPGWRDEWKVTE